MKPRGQFGFHLVVIFTATLFTPVVLALAEPPPLEIVINELAWAGSSLSANDEWLELYNPSPNSVDVGGWQLTKNTGTEALMLTIPANQTIEANRYFVVANFDMANSALAVAPNVVDSAITLSNSNLQIKLYKGDWTDPANLIDTAGDGGVPPAGNNTTKSSMERNSEDSGWHDAVLAINLDTGVIDLATPMSANSQLISPPTVESITPAQVQIGNTLLVESIVGTSFNVEPPPTVELKNGGQTIVATNVHVASPTLIDGAQFTTQTGSTTGWWDLVVTNPDLQTATLPQAVELTEPPTQYDLTTTVRINEVYPQPNTTTNDELIELYNFGDKTVNLNQWTLDDVRNGGSSEYVMGERLILPKSYLTLYKPETKLTLNDSGDEVYLIQPNGFELDHTIYDTAPRGASWSRFDDGWKWSATPTPNGKNVFTTPPTKPETPSAIDEPDDPQPVFHHDDLVISELLPNPTKTAEFIELFNATNQPIDLHNWVLKDKANHQYKISDFAVTIQATDALIIQPKQYVVITGDMSGIALNNTGGETVTLLDPSGNVIETIGYPDKAPADAVYAWENGQWTWSQYPTPGRVNILGLDEADEPPPNIEVVLPEQLPVTGRVPRWWGLGLVGGVLGAIICWHYVNRRHKRIN